MMLWIIAGLSIFIAWYVIGGRRWLKSKSWMAWYYQSAIGEWTELKFFKKSESILWARFLQVLGYGLTFLASLGGIDFTPMAVLLPDNVNWIVPAFPMLIALAGHIQVQLRMETTKPIELVALPNMVPVEVAKAAAKADAVSEQAVAVVTDAKQSGDV